MIFLGFTFRNTMVRNIREIEFQTKVTYMKNRFRDKTRDQLVDTLNLIGVKAEMTDRKSVDLEKSSISKHLEKTENSWYQRSLGLIEVIEGPIKWINILKKDGSDKSPPRWWIVMGVNDNRVLSTSRKIQLKTIRKKNFPIFGKITGVSWEGSDRDTNLAERLSKDEATKSLATRVGNIEIKIQTKEFKGWTITVDRKFNPTIEDWKTYQTIAHYLLSAPS